MDVVGSEIGQKMRSAIKAKLTELGCYVDDELPDYVMVMVANKRTRAQMEDDLQLFLGDNTELFVNWLHQVLKKLQEVTITAPLKAAEAEKGKERSKSKEKKSKDKKEKSKKGESSKKSKKKSKEKALKKKEEKKLHKSKKKSKHHDIIRPNIPPLLMNMEKESEPSITDVFAGQILKNHGVILDSHIDEPKTADQKPLGKETKRPILPIIDPASIPSQAPDIETTVTPDPAIIPEQTNEDATIEEPAKAPIREEQIKEINEIEAKIQGLKQKLAEQLDSMSDDEDFLNIRTEAEELMNDFAEDVFQEISQPPPVTPPIQARKSPPLLPSSTSNPPKETQKDIPETLPQIELNLPKRPIRERLGARKVPENEPVQEKAVEKKRQEKSPERFTPEKEPEIRPYLKSAKSRLGSQLELQRKPSTSDDSEKSEPSRRLTSRVSVLERSGRAACASVVRVRPRPRVGAPAASSLLMRAVADAHKSLLNIPPKVDQEPQKVKRALVLPMRRCVEAQKIVISVPRTDTPVSTPADSVSDNLSIGELDSDPDDKTSKRASDTQDKEQYGPMAITKVIHNTDYMSNRTLTRQDDPLLVETINIHTTTVDKVKDTQFIVTMDGYHPNAFLAKKLMTEGILNDEAEIVTKDKEKTNTVLRSRENEGTKDIVNVKTEPKTTVPSIFSHIQTSSGSIKSEESPIEMEKEIENAKQRPTLVKRKSDVSTESNSEDAKDNAPVKKRKASPIVFDVNKKEKEVDRVRERTLSASSDSHVIVTTVTNTHKYDTLPPLSAAERKAVWCRAFPQCRYGSSCAFLHPRCKFAAGCTRRGCVYSHPHAHAHAHAHAPHDTSPLSSSATVPHLPQAPQTPVLASHVVPAANYKSISAGAFANLCKYYPNCSNPACHFYHPKPCRYGKACTNKLECNFYHQDVPAAKWKYSV